MIMIMSKQQVRAFLMTAVMVILIAVVVHGVGRQQGTKDHHD